MKRWRYTPAADLEQGPLERLRNFPRQPDMLIYGVRSLIALIIRAWLRIYFRLKISGAENLRHDKSFVLVANHCSHLDTLCLLAALPLRKLHRAFPAAAEDYFFRSIPRTWVASVIVNALPFGRSVQARHGIALCHELLANPGNILIIFPEGTRSATGAIQEFRCGVGTLLAGRDLDVYPCHLEGTFRAWPKGSRFPWPGKVRLVIGARRNYAARNADKAGISSNAAELRNSVIQQGERHDTGGTHDEDVGRRGAVLSFVGTKRADG